MEIQNQQTFLFQGDILYKDDAGNTLCHQSLKKKSLTLTPRFDFSHRLELDDQTDAIQITMELLRIPVEPE